VVALSLETRASFADPECVHQGWYVVAPSTISKVHAVEVGPRRLIVYRAADGRPRVTDSRWPHRYPATERWGFIWAWLGGTPEFSLPDITGHQRTLRRQRVRAHADSIFANGFDLAHFGPSHKIEAATAAFEIKAPWEISHRVAGRLPHRLRLTWAGLGGAPLDATFSQHGGGIVCVRIRKPVEYSILFTIRPDAYGHSRTQTILFLQRRRDIFRALALLWATALDDIPLMETIVWSRRFTESDAVLERYVNFIEAMPQWR
jgi:phenylpropionate dioxygenase-like ring-hydroxylating dioxygenase large terminal subunit